MSDRIWDGVRERVAALGRANSSVFGMQGHRFELEPVLSPGEVAELEAQIGTPLPADYRAFLLEVGAGGAGPSYGLFPVRRVDGRWCWDGDGADLTELGRLAEPFPARGPDRELLAGLRAEEPDEADFDDEDEFDLVYEAWDNRYTAVWWSDDLTAGAAAICHLGCAMRQWLVITGPHAGRIWSDDRVDGAEMTPLLDDSGAPMTFTRWYMSWLDEAERLTSPESEPAT
ncbi:SMI1/KNR4 family protein [Nocardia sp. NPDC055321]